MLRILSFIAILLTLYSCTTRQQKPLPPVQSIKNGPSIISMEDGDTMSALSSLDDIRPMLLGKLNSYQADTTYKHFIVLHDTINRSYYRAEIIIGHLFHPSIESAVLGWSINDTAIDIEVFTLQKPGEWKTIFTAKNQPSFESGIPMRGEFLYFNDYNFDGWKDLEVVIETWNAIAIGSRSKLWLINKDKFTPVLNFEHIDSPELDTIDRQICSYQSGGCADMAMHFSTWQLKNNAVKMTKEIDVDCCGRDENGNCLVTVNEQKSIPVPGDKVHLYVPKYYRKWLREKMKLAN